MPSEEQNLLKNEESTNDYKHTSNLEEDSCKDRCCLAWKACSGCVFIVFKVNLIIN